MRHILSRWWYRARSIPPLMWRSSRVREGERLQVKSASSAGKYPRRCFYFGWIDRRRILLRDAKTLDGNDRASVQRLRDVLRNHFGVSISGIVLHGANRVGAMKVVLAGFGGIPKLIES